MGGLERVEWDLLALELSHLIDVLSHVELHYVGGGENFVAHLALLSLAALVDGSVLVEVGFLSEALVAARLRAVKRPFASVDAEVVEEVMPFPEKHLAATEVALQQLHVALGARVLVFVDAELSGLGD